MRNTYQESEDFSPNTRIDRVAALRHKGHLRVVRMISYVVAADLAHAVMSAWREDVSWPRGVSMHTMHSLSCVVPDAWLDLSAGSLQIGPEVYGAFRLLVLR